jgi:polysaccharide biosynthesis protein PslJ
MSAISARRMEWSPPPGTGLNGPRGWDDRSMMSSAWALYLLFGGLILWWALGAGGYIQIIFGALLLVSVIARGQVRAPQGMGLYLAFLFWVLLSTIHVSGFETWVAWVWRTLLYVGALVTFLYVFNSSRERLPSAVVVKVLALFWVMVVLGAFLAIAFPNMEFNSITAYVLPKQFVSNPFVRAMVVPEAAERTPFPGTSIRRPMLPFAYANQWGAAFVVSLPFALGALGLLKSPLKRVLLLALLFLSIVPLTFSLDRGAWVSTAATLAYAIIRIARARGGRWARAAKLMIVVSLVAGAIILLAPLGDLILLRLNRGYGDTTRELLYTSSINLVLSSPFIGYGTPISRAVVGIGPADRASVGTHGEVWTLLVSQGIPGLLLFLSWFLYSLGQTGRRLPRGWGGDTYSRLWANVAIFAGLTEVLYYEWLPWELFVLMAAAAIAWRETLVRSSLTNPNALDPESMTAPRLSPEPPLDQREPRPPRGGLRPSLEHH